MSPWIRPLYETQIAAHLKRDSLSARHFLGVYSREELPPVHSYPSSCVANTHHSSQEGEHWVAIYFDASGNGEYYDSFGLPPVYSAWEDYLDNNSRGWVYMAKTCQPLSSFACGYYAIAYIMLRSRGKSPQDIMNMFSSDLHRNDVFVYDYANRNYK